MPSGRPLENILTERREEFCHYYVHHENGARAAREAGINKSSANGWASQALKKKCVKDKLAELRRLKAGGEDIDRRLQILKLDRLIAECFKLEKPAIALASIKEQNLLKGYRKDTRRSRVSRFEGDAAQPPANIVEVSDEELERRIAEGE